MGLILCVAARKQRRHDMTREETSRATQNGGAEGEDGEMKPEPTMAGESENAGTGVGLDCGFHKAKHECRALYQIFNSRT